MDLSAESHQAWHDGYVSGWQEVLPNTIPAVPAREGGVPPGVLDSPQYYYDEAKALGRVDALKRASGLAD